MKILLSGLLIFFSLKISYCQDIIVFGGFPVNENERKSIKTDELLSTLKWEKIKSLYTPYNNNIFEYSDSLITTYRYRTSTGLSFFEVQSFDGKVLRFKSELATPNQSGETKYFDKAVWFSYVLKRIPSIPEEFRIPMSESAEIYEAYYQLLGAGTWNIYGWYCEQRALPRLADRRLATFKLVENERRDLLKKILNWPNIQSQLYATDALIYLDYEVKRKIADANKRIVDNDKYIDSLRSLSGIEKEKIDLAKENTKIIKSNIKYLEGQLLTSKDWEKIFLLRDSNKEVITCQNGTGSYKTDRATTKDILSDFEIGEIPRLYERLRLYRFYR